MSSSQYEMFRQGVFEEFKDLLGADKELILIDLIQAGQRCGVDVITEIVKKHRPASEVMGEVKRKQ